MNIFKKIMLFGLMMLLGGIVLQSIGYIDSPLFEWFVDVEFFDI